VSADSAGAGHGSRFVVRLPLAAAPAAQPEPTPTPAALLHGGRVLLVDDNRDAAESLGALVADAGYEVRIAHDGPAALEAVAAGFAPDLALLDIGLPGMTGYELAAELRARLPEVGLVAITGYGREPDRVRALAAAFDEHLVKPVRIDALLAAMARLRPR
jgi:CheY-like chemotaxis protein